MFKIEKNVPVPASSVGSPQKYPWRDMEVGDSFFVPGKKSQSFSAHDASSRTGFKFVVRTVEGGVRVWRVA